LLGGCAQMSVNSVDYVYLTGSRELLNEVKYKQDLSYPWASQDVEHNRQIVKEYLEFRYKTAQEKIDND